MRLAGRPFANGNKSGRLWLTIRNLRDRHGCTHYASRTRLRIVPSVNEDAIRQAKIFWIEVEIARNRSIRSTSPAPGRRRSGRRKGWSRHAFVRRAVIRICGRVLFEVAIDLWWFAQTPRRTSPCVVIRQGRRYRVCWINYSRGASHKSGQGRGSENSDRGGRDCNGGGLLDSDYLRNSAYHNTCENSSVVLLKN